MSRITMSPAESMARKLIAPHLAKLNLKEAELSKAVQEMYNNTCVPKEVLAFNEKFPGWIPYSTCINASGNGVAYERINLVGKDSVLKKHNTGSTVYAPTPAEGKKLSKLIDYIQNERKRIDDLKKQIEVTLVDLKTYKRVREHFPEAAAILPDDPGMPMLPTVNIDSLRKQITHV